MDGRTGRTMFLENIKSIFFIFDGRTQVFFFKKKIKLFKVVRTDEPIF